ncbi:MAG: hypothetical protein HY301_19955 [Verrucomicrobia bacterium]|nr:hypothetical protein [Verrucomicrobiota bacterium]
MNLMYVAGISNSIALEVWNSYSNAFPRALSVQGYLQTIMALTNSTGLVVWPASRTPANLNITSITNVPANTWEGAVGMNGTNGFRVLFQTTNMQFLTNSVYTNFTKTFIPLGTNAIPRYSKYEINQGFYPPDWTLVITNRLRYYLYDTSVTPNQLVDFVNITNEVRLNLAQALGGGSGLFSSGAGGGQYWDNTPAPLNYLTTPGVWSRGVLAQIATSLNAGSSDWSPAVSATPDNSQATSATNFQSYLTSSNTQKLSMQAPFNPFMQLYHNATFQVNDPMVHYLGSDITDPNPTSRVTPQPPPSNIRKINDRYQPWGGKREVMGSIQWSTAPPYVYDLSVKDPLVRWSDEWDFPNSAPGTSTNKFGNAGWIGRVHRGTPWQTIYLKSPVADTNDWYRWAGDVDTHPTNDWKLADLFTVAVDANSVRAQLSLNQTNLAAWSAALTGIDVLSSASPGYNSTALLPPVLADQFIAPSSAELQFIYQGIQNVRTNQPNLVFTNLATLLTAPELSVASPYLGATPSDMANYALNDAAVERLPQQLLSLLNVEDAARVVVYCWGQSLKPADRSIVVTPGPNFGLCTNYQIAGEVGTKAVLRFEKRVTTTPPATNINVVVESYQVLPTP